MSHPTPLAVFTLLGVILCWIVFAGIFLLRKRPPKPPEAKRDNAATAGIALQMVAYFLVWFQPPWQPFLAPVPVLSGTLGVLFSLGVIGLAAASGWLIESAVHTLGKQWAIPARLVKGHKLITVGPYAHVRNPIYTGMFGMLIATGLAMEHWTASALAVALFAVGMVIRVRCEEKLMRSAFGSEFDEYARRVPAVIPGIF